MSRLSYDEERQAKENLEKAFREIRRGHYSSSVSNMELSYEGNSSIGNLLERGKNQIQDLISKIEYEERSCDEYLQRYCPAFYKETSSSRVVEWLNDARSEEGKKAKVQIDKAVENIDEYLKTKSRELANSFADGLKRRFNDINAYGLGRPWGTAIRQRLATAVGLKIEVNNLFELGLNSVANSQRIYLGGHFVDLLKNDDIMQLVRRAVGKEIVSDIRSRAYKVPYLAAQKLDGMSICGFERGGFGGRRNTQDGMLQQLKFTMQHPIDSFSKYSDTWNAGVNELTWTIRNGTIEFKGIYHAVYNVCGFAYLWEMEFSIEDVLDLRPHSKDKLNFDTDYNIITSILGTAYHDLLGNTDKLKVRAHWQEMGGDNEGKIHSW